MWTRMLTMMVGRVTIAVILIALVSVLVLTLWYQMLPHLPGLARDASEALAYASERLGWLWSWLVAQF